MREEKQLLTERMNKLMEQLKDKEELEKRVHELSEEHHKFTETIENL